MEHPKHYHGCMVDHVFAVVQTCAAHLIILHSPDLDHRNQTKVAQMMRLTTSNISDVKHRNSISILHCKICCSVFLLYIMLAETTWPRHHSYPPLLTYQSQNESAVFPGSVETALR